MRGKNAEYSNEFETAWKQYGRKDEKADAYVMWKIRAKEFAGGEGELLGLVLTHLSWQGPLWAQEGWKFAKYFERYLKKRKWTDQPAAAPTRTANPKTAGNLEVLRDWKPTTKGFG